YRLCVWLGGNQGVRTNAGQRHLQGQRHHPYVARDRNTYVANLLARCHRYFPSSFPSYEPTTTVAAKSSAFPGDSEDRYFPNR
ncbi:hypothetical protein U1Q18_039270, partial [Sarracenia purpurea var. burkii]